MSRRLVVWGGQSGDLASHRHIHSAFYETARKMGYNAIWVNDGPGYRDFITPGSLVIAVDIWSSYLGDPVPGVDYCLHNFSGDWPFCQAIAPENLLRLQVWTNEACGEEWSPYRSFDREAQTLFQPWGSDILPEEFLEPSYSPYSQEVAFIGAVWSHIYNGKDLGNTEMIEQLKLLCADRALRLHHLTHVSNAEMIAATREARLAPAFAGNWQVEHNYLPCRAFKNPAYGVLAISNVPAIRDLYKPAHPSGSEMGEWLDSALSLKRSEYQEMVREQQRVASGFTYRESLQAIERAFEEIKC